MTKQEYLCQGNDFRKCTEKRNILIVFQKVFKIPLYIANDKIISCGLKHFHNSILLLLKNLCSRFKEACK